MCQTCWLEGFGVETLLHTGLHGLKRNVYLELNILYYSNIIFSICFLNFTSMSLLVPSWHLHASVAPSPRSQHMIFSKWPYYLNYCIFFNQSHCLRYPPLFNNQRRFLHILSGSWDVLFWKKSPPPGWVTLESQLITIPINLYIYSIYCTYTERHNCSLALCMCTFGRNITYSHIT